MSGIQLDRSWLELLLMSFLTVLQQLGWGEYLIILFLIILNFHEAWSLRHLLILFMMICNYWYVIACNLCAP